MASSQFTPATASLHRQPLPTSPTPSHSTISLPRFFTCNSCTPTNILSSTSTLFHRSTTSYPFLPSISISNSNSNSISGCRSRCLATSPRPPSPPQSEPPSGKDPFSSSSGLPDKFSRFQEVVQIFLAVLFWMSLFFWSSIWDGKNNGRSDKGSRPRR